MNFRNLVGLGLLGAGLVAAQPQYFISTVAGGAPPITPAASTGASIGQPQRVAVDSSGNFYFSASNAVFKVTSSGTMTVVAGNGRAGYSGDGGLATQAQLNGPQGIAIDYLGNIYIADSNNNLVRIVTKDGNINTFAGSTNYGAIQSGWTGDGGPANQATLHLPLGLAVDGAGNLYIADSANNAIRKVTTDGNINTIAGLGPILFGYLGDAGQATAAWLNGPQDVAVDSNGIVYIADTNNARIREITTDGNINYLAGNGVFGYGGDGGPAGFGSLAGPTGVAVDSAGKTVYITTIADNRIRVVDTTQTLPTINTLAGTGGYGFVGDGGPATKAQMSAPRGLALDGSGNVYLTDTWNNRVREIIKSGTINTVAGNGQLSFAGDIGPALSAQFSSPSGVALDKAGNIYISDTANNRVRMVAPDGTTTTIAGNGNVGFSGDGGPATSAALNAPLGLAVDSSGNLYIADSGNGSVRVVSGGTITTFAGTGVPGYSGDGGPANKAQMGAPAGLTFDSNGNLYIADYYGWVRKVTASNGTISTLAGIGDIGYSGDGGPANQAQLNNPQGVATDSQGNVYIADTNNGAVRLVTPNGIITTIAGDGNLNYSGDGGSAVYAELGQVRGIVVDSLGNLYVSDANYNVVRVFPTVNGVISTIAGTGRAGYTGDGGTATTAQLNGPVALALAPNGSIYVADSMNNAVRLLKQN